MLFALYNTAMSDACILCGYLSFLSETDNVWCTISRSCYIWAKTDPPCSAVSLRQLSYLFILRVTTTLSSAEDSCRLQWLTSLLSEHDCTVWVVICGWSRPFVCGWICCLWMLAASCRTVLSGNGWACPTCSSGGQSLVKNGWARPTSSSGGQSLVKNGWACPTSSSGGQSLAIAKRACDCCIILNSGSYTKAI